MVLLHMCLLSKSVNNYSISEMLNSLANFSVECENEALFRNSFFPLEVFGLWDNADKMSEFQQKLRSGEIDATRVFRLLKDESPLFPTPDTTVDSKAIGIYSG